jgi:hypothetical protein
VRTLDAIHRGRLEGVTSDGQVVPITAMFAPGGVETDDIHEAVSAVCGSDAVGWWTVTLSDFPPSSTH